MSCPFHLQNKRQRTWWVPPCCFFITNGFKAKRTHIQTWRNYMGDSCLESPTLFVLILSAGTGGGQLVLRLFLKQIPFKKCQAGRNYENTYSELRVSNSRKWKQLDTLKENKTDIALPMEKVNIFPTALKRTGCNTVPRIFSKEGRYHGLKTGGFPNSWGSPPARFLFCDRLGSCICRFAQSKGKHGYKRISRNLMLRNCVCLGVRYIESPTCLTKTKRAISHMHFHHNPTQRCAK